MKRFLRGFTLFCAAVLIVSAAGCNSVDKSNGEASKNQDLNLTATDDHAKIHQIKSSDTIMPNYFDISRYDEENYADIYLGKKFEFNITYDGSKLTVPTTYKEMSKSGWEFIETSEYGVDSFILAGETVKTQMINQYHTQITAVFYNSSNSSVKLSKCSIVKLIISENSQLKKDSVYGQFWINGVTNQSAITDVIEYLGAPSHFYALAPNNYYLDYFITEKDKRNGITIYIDPTEDNVLSIEFSYYK